MAVVKVIEVMAESTKSWEDATRLAVRKASKTIKGISSAWVQDQSVTVVDGEVTKYRVSLKLSFAIND